MMGCFPWIALFRLTSEASTVFLNIRWFMIHLKMKFTRLYLINMITIMVSFGIVRIAVILPFWYLLWNESLTAKWITLHFAYKFICISVSLTLDVLNIYWYHKLFKSFKKLIKSRKMQSQKKLQKVE
jgi:hypothetical protein